MNNANDTTTTLHPREQKRIVRSTAIAQGQIDRITANLDANMYDTTSSWREAMGLREKLRAKVRANVATLQARGVRTK